MSTASHGSGSPNGDPSDAVRNINQQINNFSNIKLEPDAFGMLPPPDGSNSHLTSDNSTINKNFDLFMTPKNDRIPSSLIDSLLDPLTEIRKPTLQKPFVGLSDSTILPDRASSMPPETPISLNTNNNNNSDLLSARLGSPITASFPLTFASQAAQIKTENNSNSSSSNNTNNNNNNPTSELSIANAITTSGGSNALPTSTEYENEVDESARVSAYARLDFESFTFYVQTLQVILGRRAENGTGMVDVHLGPAKAISRRHAKIFYNFGTQRFELSVLGRNGAFVGDVFVETGSTVPLSDGTKVQIGQIPFTFVLPSVMGGENNDDGKIEEIGEEVDGGKNDNGSVDEGTLIEAANATEALSLDDIHKDTSGSVSVEHMTPIRKESQDSSSLVAPPGSSGPEIDAQLKAIEEAASLDANIDPQFAQELIQATSGVLGDAAVGNLLAGGYGDLGSTNGSGTGSSGKSKKKIRREYLPEEIPLEYREKPQHSYSHLIATALRSRSPIAGLSLSDIYKAIQEIFPYYEYCPHGWQNSVRHNLSSNKAFRKVSKEGKGWLWGIDEEYFLEKERQKKKAAAAKSKAAAIQAAQQAARQQQELLQQQQQQQLQLQQLQLQQQQNEINNILNASTDEQLQLLQQFQQQQHQQNKSVGDLGSDLEINSDGNNQFQPNYFGKTSLSGSTRILPSGRQPSFTEYNPTIAGAVSPSPNSIQAQLAANLQQRQISRTPSTTPAATTTPVVQPSLAAGQNTFRMAKPSKQPIINTATTFNQPSLKQSTSVPQMRVQPSKFYQSGSAGQSSSNSQGNFGSGTSSIDSKPNATLAAVQSAGLSLAPDTIKALGVLQQKIQTQIQSMGIGTGANSHLLTNALAVAIAQAVKSGGANSISSLLNGKNPAQLTQLLQTALQAMSKKKTPSTAASAASASVSVNSNSTSPSNVTVPVNASPSIPTVTLAENTPIVTTSVTTSATVSPVVPTTPINPVVTSVNDNIAVVPTVGVAPIVDSSKTASVTPEPIIATNSTPQVSTNVTSVTQPPISTNGVAEVTTSTPVNATTTPTPNATATPITTAPTTTAPTTTAPTTTAPTTAPTTSAPTTSAPTITASTTTTTAPVTKPTSKAAPSAATIAQLLAQASKISNPSPSMLAALEQLRAHASKLNAAAGTSIPIPSGSTNTTSKRPADESIESLDKTAIKAPKGS